MEDLFGRIPTPKPLSKKKDAQSLNSPSTKLSTPTLPALGRPKRGRKPMTEETKKKALEKRKQTQERNWNNSVEVEFLRADRVSLKGSLERAVVNVQRYRDRASASQQAAAKALKKSEAQEKQIFELEQRLKFSKTETESQMKASLVRDRCLRGWINTHRRNVLYYKLSQTENSVKGIFEERDKLQNAIQEALAVHDQEVANIKRELDITKGNAEKTTRELLECRRTLKRADESVGDHEKRLVTAIIDQDHLQNAIDLLEEKEYNLQQECGSLKATLLALQQELKSSTATILSQQQKLESLRATAEALQIDLEMSKTEIRVVRDEGVGYRADLERTQAELSECRDQLSASTVTHEEAIVHKNQTIARLGAQKRELETALAAQQRPAANHLSRIDGQSIIGFSAEINSLSKDPSVKSFKYQGPMLEYSRD